ncbi:hypothetical protein CGC53_01400 [Capnocytophaga leadbetteri]|uniref:Uncharacterized protein n=1 Tax=Capnocytophaga leadbetteri TaxID=327575 RepID=A0A250F7H6_9FLAO|nr:hypothetical protein CGC53_01400 [Capnocytophaga leadbetteri]
MRNEADYKALMALREKINNKTASFEEQKQYVRMLADEGKMTEEQYQMFAQKDKLQNDVLDAALIIGGGLLLVWLASKYFEK